MARYYQTEREYIADDVPARRPAYLLPVLIAVALIALVVVLVFGLGFGHHAPTPGGPVQAPSQQMPAGGSGH